MEEEEEEARELAMAIALSHSDHSGDTGGDNANAMDEDSASSPSPGDDDDEAQQLAQALALSKAGLHHDEDEDVQFAAAMALSMEGPPGGGEEKVGTKEVQLERRIRELFTEATGRGVPPNDAAALAIEQAQSEIMSPPPPPPPSDDAVLEKAGFEARVKELFAEATARGVAPNDAAAAALQKTQAEVAAAQTDKMRREADKRNAAAAAAGGEGEEGGGILPPPALVRTRSAPQMVEFVRLEEIEALAQEQLDVINELYRTDGVTFIDDQFPPTNRSLYTSDETATTWRCRGCRQRNPLPAHRHTGEELFAVMRDPSRTITCTHCQQKSTEMEVAMRPSGWMKPAFLRDDISFQASTVPWVVFRGDPRPDDLRQGGVGNCWFVCALSVIAERPEHIRRILLTREHNPAGAYQVRLCRSGTWHTVTIDDVFPTNALDMLAYLKAARRSLWGPLIEKAAAKLWGSYEALAGGTFAEAFAMLTGFPVQTVRFDSYREPSAPSPAALQADPEAGAAHEQHLKRWREENGSQEDKEDELFAQVFSYKQNGFAIGASTFVVPGRDDALGDEMRAKGLQHPHAYGVLDVVALDADASVDGDEAQSGLQRLVKLRNPNGHAGWRGAWGYSAHGGTFSTEDRRWTFARRRQLAIDRDDAGVFWMGWGDFCRYFAELTVCRLLENHLEARQPGWLTSAFGAGEAVAIDVYTRTHVEVAAWQEQHVHRGGQSHRTMVDLGVGVMKLPSASASAAAALIAAEHGGSADGAGVENAAGTLVAFGERVAHDSGAPCQATLEHDDFPSTRYLVVPLCFGHVRSTEPRKFTVSVHSPSPLTIETIPITAEFLGSTVIACVVMHGKRRGLLGNAAGDALVLYELNETAGTVIVAENLSPFTVQVEVDASDHTVGFTSSRNTHFSQDVIPPRHRQVVFLLSQDTSSERFGLSIRYGASVIDGNAGFELGHIPSLDALGNLRGLHEPQPISAGPPPRAAPATVGRVDTAALASSLFSMLQQSK